ncbi:(d)CMP kinase [Bacteroidia bacterium]|nr:(d)CMP kinase [Bacteroidia bacterium]MDB4107478.1 (d)CMP kinase [Bacteroidia bacterium]MDB9881651.1 (d)CMP kinase [Bacteroidia bacterium]
MDNKIIIAIDGHSSCGKGTLAKNLAKELGYLFIDSGAMYRAVTLYLLRNNIPLEEVAEDPALLGNIKITFVYDAEKSFYETYLNGENVEKEIRSMEVSRRVSPVSAIRTVRLFLVAQQQNIGANRGVVMDGRDIGTVVFPDAELKIFMTASAEIRAKRRYEELQKKGIHVNYQEVLHNIRERDHIDSTRDESPLAKAEDAITLDNSAMSKDVQARLALQWARGVIKSLAHQ